MSHIYDGNLSNDPSELAQRMVFPAGCFVSSAPESPQTDEHDTVSPEVRADLYDAAVRQLRLDKGLPERVRDI